MSNPTHEPGCWALVKQVARLLHSWWRRDAIRVSPAEGRLLRLEPSCCLLIRGQPVQVLGHCVRKNNDNNVVVYSCWTGAGVGELTVEPGEKLNCRWSVNEDSVALAPTEIEVYA